MNSPTYYALKLLKQSLIMFLLENTNFAFFQEKILVVYIDYIQSKQDITSFITVEDLIRNGIQKEELSSNLYSF